MISFFEKYFSTCAASKISFALRLKVVSSVSICCLTNCCVKVDPPEEPIPVASENRARSTALGTYPLCSSKYSSSVLMIAVFNNGEI